MKFELEIFDKSGDSQTLLELYCKASDVIDRLEEGSLKKDLEKELEECDKTGKTEQFEKLLAKLEPIKKNIEEKENNKFPDTIEEESSFSANLTAEQKEEIEEELFQMIGEIMKNDANELGEGDTAEVYINDEYSRICFKIMKRNGYENRKTNTPKTETKIMDELALLNIGAVRIPKPIYFSMTKRMHLLAMETINGATLEEILSGKKKIPQGITVDWAENFNNLRKFIVEMNNLGIRHRDIIEKNIMLDFDTLRLFLIDFGSAIKIERKDFDRYNIDETYNIFDIEKNLNQEKYKRVICNIK
jgi:tRNA A-37 threonylcarbamoyl transferase component Bud32